MCLDLFSEDWVPCGSILVSDHSVFAFLVVAHGRFDYVHKSLWPNTYNILPFACPSLDAKVKSTRKIGETVEFHF